MEIRISVVTPTIRPEGLAIMRDSLLKQTFKDFEWIVDINITGKHDLNASFNKMIKRAKGELIVFYEDFTRIQPDALEKWWRAYQEYPNTLFTAPLSKCDNLDFKPPYKWDWRAYKQNEGQTDYTECLWRCCELDWGAIPKKILYEIGGFDEELDKYWSCDNVNVGCRADIKGYKFKCLFSNPAVAYDHDAFMEHPFRKNFNATFNNQRMEDFRGGLTIDFLGEL